MARVPLLIAVFMSIITSRLGAEDVRPPSDLTPPLTAYARATADGKVTLRLPDSSTEPAPAAISDPATPPNRKSLGWRIITVDLNDPSIKARDVSGKTVAADQVRKALSQETPVLVSGSAIDKFHLLTTKPETIIFTVPPGLLLAPRLPSSSTPRVAVDTSPESGLESTLLKLANAERDKAKVPPLTMSPLLLKAARQHSANMVKQGKLEHQLDGKGVSDRLNDLGYLWRACGENIALGPRAPGEAIRSWMESPGHRANLLSPDFTQIGVATLTDAAGEPYWTMVLAAPR